MLDEPKPYLIKYDVSRMTLTQDVNIITHPYFLKNYIHVTAIARYYK